MILSNTVASSVVLNGATSTVSTPADESAPAGFMPSSNGKSWVALPGPAMSVVAIATPGSGGTSYFDWTLGSYFVWTPYGGSCTISFLSAAGGALTPSVGQIIIIKFLHAASASVTWPTTISWLSGSSGAAPTFATKDAVVAFVCTATGSAPTYDAWTIAQQS
jgi:hypothetical protein